MNVLHIGLLKLMENKHTNSQFFIYIHVQWLVIVDSHSYLEIKVPQLLLPVAHFRLLWILPWCQKRISFVVVTRELIVVCGFDKREKRIHLSKIKKTSS